MIVDDATYAAWSPDGGIAYVNAPAGDSQIVVANADGSDPQMITNEGGVAPQWSPDASRLVFTSFRNGRGQLFVIDADGTDERQLESDDIRTAGFGTWSPDGTRIAFSSTRDRSCPGSEHRDCPRRVYTIAADGTGVRQLVTGSDLDQYPVYVPLPSRQKPRTRYPAAQSCSVDNVAAVPAETRTCRFTATSAGGWAYHSSSAGGVGWPTATVTIERRGQWTTYRTSRGNWPVGTGCGDAIVQRSDRVTVTIEQTEWQVNPDERVGAGAGWSCSSPPPPPSYPAA
jgi:dipeptidyl aminopeptidase/acylaminoacyl peptidase